MNRQTKRLMQRQQADRPRAPERKARPQAAPQRERTGPRQYLGEVRGELKKVAWPSRHEVVNSTIIVLIAVVFMTSLIFGYDYDDWPMDPVIEAFETLARLRVHLSDRHTAAYDRLVHPVHARGRVFAWEINARPPQAMR